MGKWVKAQIVVFASLLILAGCAGGGSDETFSVGLLTNNANGLRNVDGFRAGMAELGYIEGQNINYLYLGEPVPGGELDAAVAAMLEADVDLIFTAGTPTGVAAYEATRATDTPVVFGVIADPIRAGVMSDLAEPGGNITGVKLDDDQSRRLQYLVEIAGGLETVLVIFNPEDAAATSAVAQIADLAPSLGVQLELVEARDSSDVTAALEAATDAIDAIFMVPDSVVNAHLADIVAVALRLGIPTSGPSIAQVEGGALTTYGFVHRDAGAQAAHFADRVLRGADPGQLPVEDTESFLAINLDTAEAIGLDIPDALLGRADFVLRSDSGE